MRPFARSWSPIGSYPRLFPGQIMKQGRISDTIPKFFFIYKKNQGFLDISELRDPILIIFGALESSVSRLFDVIFFEGF